MNDFCFYIDNYKNKHIVWLKKHEFYLDILYSNSEDNLFEKEKKLYSFKNEDNHKDILISDSSIVKNNYIYIAFIENCYDSNSSILKIIKKDKEKEDITSFNLPVFSYWCGIYEYNGINYIFTIDHINRINCYIYKDQSKDLHKINSWSIICKNEVSHINTCNFGRYLSFSVICEFKIRYNFFNFQTKNWIYSNFPVFKNSCPYGNSILNGLSQSISGYELEIDKKNIGNLCIVWSGYDEYSNFVLLGSTITTEGKEWPLDLKNHLISSVEFSKNEEYKWNNFCLVKNCITPQIILFGNNIKKFCLVKEGIWEVNDLLINNWPQDKRKRKSFAYFIKQQIHTVIKDESGIYEFSSLDYKVNKF